MNVTISQACYSVGINNLSYFFKLFKRIEGSLQINAARN